VGSSPTFGSPYNSYKIASIEKFWNKLKRRSRAKLRCPKPSSSFREKIKLRILKNDREGFENILFFNKNWGWASIAILLGFLAEAPKFFLRAFFAPLFPKKVAKIFDPKFIVQKNNSTT
jgi:hypothetical protein